MNVGDLVQYPFKPGHIGIIIAIVPERTAGDIYRVWWGNCRDIRSPVWCVHPDWAEVVQHV